MPISIRGRTIDLWCGHTLCSQGVTEGLARGGTYKSIGMRQQLGQGSFVNGCLRFCGSNVQLLASHIFSRGRYIRRRCHPWWRASRRYTQHTLHPMICRSGFREARLLPIVVLGVDLVPPTVAGGTQVVVCAVSAFVVLTGGKWALPTAITSNARRAIFEAETHHIGARLRRNKRPRVMVRVQLVTSLMAAAAQVVVWAHSAFVTLAYDRALLTPIASNAQ